MFAALGSLSLEAFIQQKKRDDNLWMFLHVPKTAGSSFGSELARARQPYRNIHVDFTDASVPIRKQMDLAVQKFIGELDERTFRSCSGHFRISHADAIARKCPNSDLVTFLRHPVDRVISNYRYARTPAHPYHKEFRERFPDLESYVDMPGRQNTMFQFLIRDQAATIPKAIAYLDERYAFIGLVEMYSMSFNVIFRLFGENRLPTFHTRRTLATAENAVMVTPEVRRIISELNWKDVALYEHVRERLARKHDEWERFNTIRLK